MMVYGQTKQKSQRANFVGEIHYLCLKFEK